MTSEIASSRKRSGFAMTKGKNYGYCQTRYYWEKDFMFQL